MTIGDLTISKKAIAAAMILLLGLIIGVYLVQVQQIFKSKASEEDIYNAFSITQIDENGVESPVTCNGNVCETNSLEVNFKIDDLNKLTE